MKTSQRLIVGLLMAAAAPLTVQAGSDSGSMAGMKGMGDMKGMAMPDSKPSQDALSQGEVRKVDADQGSIAIKHGPLENLGMPGMTLIFRVADPAVLGQVKAGDAIRFRAEKIDGAFTVTRLEKKDGA